jgi:hypothetical protein
VKPVYHVAWLTSRLGGHVTVPLHPVRAGTSRGRTRAQAPAAKPGGTGPRPVAGGFDGRVRIGQTEVDVVLRPHLSGVPGGTTLRVELLCERRGSELRADVTAEAENVNVRVWLDGVETMERRYHAPRRTDVDLLAETIERTGPDPIATAAIKMAGALVHQPDAPEDSRR